MTAEQRRGGLQGPCRSCAGCCRCCCCRFFPQSGFRRYCRSRSRTRPRSRRKTAVRLEKTLRPLRLTARRVWRTAPSRWSRCCWDRCRCRCRRRRRRRGQALRTPRGGPTLTCAWRRGRRPGHGRRGGTQGPSGCLGAHFCRLQVDLQECRRKPAANPTPNRCLCDRKTLRGPQTAAAS